MKDELQWRENIEWQNIWWEQANNTAAKRIALLGDSVTRGYRSKLNEKIAGRYAVIYAHLPHRLRILCYGRNISFSWIAVSGNIIKLYCRRADSMDIQEGVVMMKTIQKHSGNVIRNY